MHGALDFLDPIAQNIGINEDYFQFLVCMIVVFLLVPYVIALLLTLVHRVLKKQSNDGPGLATRLGKLCRPFYGWYLRRTSRGGRVEGTIQLQNKIEAAQLT